jgi:type IV secretory pathway TraG/TraD family ATPase VirD4
MTIEQLLTEDARARHIHVIGQTGVGKSAFLLNLIAADLAAGHGVAVVDPHGELAEAVLGLVPRERFHQVIYINPTDTHPVPFNPLFGHALPDRARAADAVLSAFRAVWGWSAESAPRAVPLLRNAIRTALDLLNPTFFDVLDIIEGRNRAKATDPMNVRYWRRLESLDRKLQEDTVAPVYTRLDALLTPPVRAVLCQRPSFDLSQVMNNGQILICNLNKGALGELNSHLLGAFVVSGIVQAAMNRAPQFHQRRFYLYVDEFQNFATDSFSTALSEARTYGLSMTLAHQYTKQLPESLLSAVLGNTGTTISFRVGAEDAALMASHMGGVLADTDLNPRTLKELPNYECYARVLQGGAPIAVRLKTDAPPLPLHDRVEQLVRNSRTRFGRPAALVEQALNRSLNQPRPKKRARKYGK